VTAKPYILTNNDLKRRIDNLESGGGKVHDIVDFE
jgi:hypothetical protein